MIDADVVRHVARLARLGLDAEEAERMRAELSVILDHVGQVGRLDLDGVPPTTHVIHLANVTREDSPHESLPPEVALREAQATSGGGFSVPRIG